MHKRRLHFLLKKLQKFSYVYIVLALVVSAGVFVYSYRQNNIRALELRDRLMQVDAEDGDIETALRELREFIHSHMNAQLDGGESGIYPPIQLKYHYERLVAVEQARVESQNEQIYTEAQNYCESVVPSRVTRDRVPCIQDYVSARGVEAPQPVKDSLYKFNFVSPIWSPDLAGWSFIVAALLSIVLVSRLLLELWLRNRLSG